MPISETYNMDCMDYMRDIPDKYFELAIVDPPYQIASNPSRHGGSGAVSGYPKSQNYPM